MKLLISALLLIIYSTVASVWYIVFYFDSEYKDFAFANNLNYGATSGMDECIAAGDPGLPEYACAWVRPSDDTIAGPCTERMYPSPRSFKMPYSVGCWTTSTSDGQNCFTTTSDWVTTGLEDTCFEVADMERAIEGETVYFQCRDLHL